MFGACLDPSFVDARVGFLKNRGNRGVFCGDLKKRGSWIGIGLVGYILPVDWNKAKMFPSGSLRTAKYPTVGISCFAVTTWAPRLVALAADSSMELTEKYLTNCSFGALRLKSPPMVSFAGASL